MTTKQTIIDSESDAAKAIADAGRVVAEILPGQPPRFIIATADEGAAITVAEQMAAQLPGRFGVYKLVRHTGKERV